jgi:hypothetical protein
MKMGLSRSAAAFFASTLPFAGAANATVYTIEGQDLPPATVSGTITTDGALGVLTIGDIVSTDLTVSDGVNTAVLNGEIELGGSSLIATSTALFFDYSVTGVFGVFGGTLANTSAYCLGANEVACGLVQDGAAIEVVSKIYGGDLELDKVQIATASAAVPEPSTWAMMLFGFAGLGYAASRRKSAKRATLA